jgi:hypothetical protein
MKRVTPVYTGCNPRDYTLAHCRDLLLMCPEGCTRLFLISQEKPVHHRFNKSKGGNIRRLSRSGAAPQLDALKGAAR